MKKRMPETDWEIMQADSDVVEPKKKPKQNGCKDCPRRDPLCANGYCLIGNKKKVR